MKRIFTFVLVTLVACSSLWAADLVVKQKNAVAPGQVRRATMLQEQCGKPASAGVAQTASTVIDRWLKPQSVGYRHSVAGVVTSTDDLTGTWVLTAKSYNNWYGGQDVGCSVVITPIAGTDSILIDNLELQGWVSTSIRAHVNPATGTITIPRQLMASDANYGYSFSKAEGYFEQEGDVLCTIETNGDIVFNTGWTILRSDNHNLNTFSAEGTRLTRANATVTEQVLNMDGTTGQVTYGVVARQTANNRLEVTNFGNGGQKLVMQLYNNRKGHITDRWLWKTWWSQLGGYTFFLAQTQGLEIVDGSSITVQAMNYAFDTEAATALDEVRLTNLAIMPTNGTNTYVHRIITEATIALDFDVSYPDITAHAPFVGSGSESDPYLIRNVQDLVALSDSVNSRADGSNVTRFTGKYFRLTDDIDLEGYVINTIGDSFAYFTFDGTFDGNGHTISNLRVTTDQDQTYTALFGVVNSNGVVRNLKIDQARVQAEGPNTAIIAGASLGTIEDCEITHSTVSNIKPWYTYASPMTGIVCAQGKAISRVKVADCQLNASEAYVGAITGYAGGAITDCEVCRTDVNQFLALLIEDSYPNPIGGLVGMMDTHSSLKKSYFQGNINIRTEWSDDYEFRYLGGLCGYMNGNTVIDQCFALVNISNHRNNSLESLDLTGGLVSWMQPLATLTNSYVVGDYDNGFNQLSGSGMIHAAAFDWDIEVGATVQRCYTLMGGSIKQAVVKQSDETFSNVFYDKQISQLNPGAYGALTSKLTAATGPGGLNTTIWTFREGFYPVLKCFEDNEYALMASTAVLMDENNSFRVFGAPATISKHDGVKVTVHGPYLTVDGDQLALTGDAGTDTLYVGDDSFTIKRKVVVVPDEFQAQGSGTEDDPWLITNKADLLKVQNYTVLKNETFAGKFFKVTDDIDIERDAEFVGLGTFAGEIDGDGHTLHGLCSPLVNQLEETGVIKSLSVAADGAITRYLTTGYAAFAETNKGLVESCANYMDITAYIGVAGIVANNQGTVRGCLNAGNITSMAASTLQCGGGIAATSSGDISNCVNLGTLSHEYKSMPMNLGGIVGYLTAGKVSNVMNLGGILPDKDTQAGGIVGTWAEGVQVECAINCGGTSLGAMAVVHDDGVEGQLTNVYYDLQLGGLGIGEALETASLTDGTPLEGFDTELWSFTQGMYPMLQHFNDNNLAQNARKAIVNIPTGITCRNLTDDAALAQNDALTWSLKTGDDFTIDGAILKTASPSTNGKMLVDTLVADYGGCAKLMLLHREPVMPFTQSGTEQDPYLIRTVDEWNAIGNWAEFSGENYQDKHFMLVNDIDFTDAEFVQAGTFNGVFDGNGNTMRGIDCNIIVTTDTQQGVFCVLGESGIIRNLTVEGEITTTASATGGLVGLCKGTIDNCTNRVDVTMTNSHDYTGGIAAFVNNTGQILSCVNEGNITGRAYVGGIAGYSKGIIESCENNGNVKSTGGTYTGGICGNTTNTVTDCVNKGNVEANGNYTGGIAGASSTLVINCVNSGTVISTNGYVGGIVGNGSNATTITNCLNAGDVNAQYKNNVGGILGAGRGTLNACVNVGTVTARNTVAGIVGNPESNTLNNCYNRGEVIVTSTNGKAGNIICSNNAATMVNNCRYVTDNAIEGIDSIGTIPVSLAELCAMDMNNPENLLMAEGEPTWQNYDEYSLPMPITIADLDVVKVAAAEVILADGDTREQVTQDFHVGLPEGCEWSVDVPVVAFEGNDARIVQSYNDVVMLTVTCGEYSKTIQILINAIVSGVDGVTAGQAVEAEQWYTLDGRMARKPQDRDGQVYIVVRRYKDGTQHSFKLRN